MFIKDKSEVAEKVQGFQLKHHVMKVQLKEMVTYPWQNLHVVQSILCLQGRFAGIVCYKTAA